MTTLSPLPGKELESTIKKVILALGDPNCLNKKTQQTLLTLLRSTLKDIRKQKQENNGDSNLRLVQQVAHIGSWDLDIVRNVLSWSEEIYRIFEMEPGENKATYERFLELVHPEDRKMVDNAYYLSLQNKTKYEITHRLQFPDGRIKFVEQLCEHFFDGDGKAIRSFGTMQDITQQELMQQKKIETKILEVSEKEQQRLGQYIHDDIGQMLSGLRLISQNLSQRLKANGLHGAEEVQEISDYIHEVDKKVRDLARGLASSAIKSETLQLALRQLALKTRHLYGIQCTFECNTRTKIKEKYLIQHLYRISQEAIRNAVIHGKADHIILSLEQHPRQLQLSIIDNGIGFPKDLKKTENEGMGIVTMKHRSQKLGGHFKIDKTEDGLTRINCCIPVQK